MKVLHTLQKCCCLLAGIVPFFFCETNNALAQQADAWQNEITIYGWWWYAGIDGAVNSPGGSKDITVEAMDIIENLNRGV